MGYSSPRTSSQSQEGVVPRESGGQGESGDGESEQEAQGDEGGSVDSRPLCSLSGRGYAFPWAGVRQDAH